MTMRWNLPFLFALAAFAAVPTPAGAAAQRTFVASNGLDSNPCTINLPCRSFGTAIGQTLAGGEVVVLDSAGYGPVAITKSISLVAPPGVYAGISVPSGGTGITVNAAGSSVVLRGLSINGAGGDDGIVYSAGDRLRIESCLIAGLSGTAITHSATGGELFMLDSIIRDNAGAGVIAAVDATSVFDNVRIEHNGGDGIFVQAVNGNAFATFRNGTSVRNGYAGITIGTPAAVSARIVVAVEGSTLSHNGADGITAGGSGLGASRLSVSRSSFTQNAYSGVSAFHFGAMGSVLFAVVRDCTFTEHPTSAVKSDGSLVEIHVSSSAFNDNYLNLDVRNNSKIYTFQDNIGTPTSYNGATTIGSKF